MWFFAAAVAVGVVVWGLINFDVSIFPTPDPTEAREVSSAPTPVPSASAPTPAPPGLEPGAERVREKDGMKMLYVPAGDFTMGSPTGEGESNEWPQHQVYLDAYYIDETEVSFGQYTKCVQARACEGTGGWSDRFNAPAQPRVDATWWGAHAYCDWVGGRLPTEAEWEKAARGLDGRRYPWGNSAPDCGKAQYRGCADDPLPVGSQPAGASPYGILDMAGSLWEWVADRYGGSYYAESPRSNPEGPMSGSLYVIRGGGWKDGPADVRAARRQGVSRVASLSTIGFRCVVPESD